MNYCLKCKTLSNERFCTACGLRLIRPKCRGWFCGASLSGPIEFCGSCGRAISYVIHLCLVANRKRLADEAEAAAKWRAEHPPTPLTADQLQALQAQALHAQPFMGLSGIFGGRG